MPQNQGLATANGVKMKISIKDTGKIVVSLGCAAGVLGYTVQLWEPTPPMPALPPSGYPVIEDDMTTASLDVGEVASRWFWLNS